MLHRNSLPVKRLVRGKRSCRTDPFADLIILDCSMPKMGGLEVLRRIRANHELFSTPVLMLTGRSSAAGQQIAFDAGNTEYLRKPFDRERLVFIVENMLEEFRKRYGAQPQAKRSL